jgi:hypothetical protein
MNNATGTPCRRYKMADRIGQAVAVTGYGLAIVVFGRY